MHDRSAELATIAFELSPVGIVVAEHRIIRRANAAFVAIFGLADEVVEGLTLGLFYPTAEDSERTAIIAQKPLRATGHYSDERTMMRRDGQLFWCGVTGRSATPDDPLAQVIWCFQDLSQQWNLHGLSSRDREIAILTCAGRTAKEIARLLNLSPRTIETYIARLRHKLDARNVAELVSRIKPESDQAQRSATPPSTTSSMPVT